MNTGFNFRSLVALASSKEVNLFFEALKPGIDFSSLPMKVLGSVFFQYKAILFTFKIYHLG